VLGIAVEVVLAVVMARPRVRDNLLSVFALGVRRVNIGLVARSLDDARFFAD